MTFSGSFSIRKLHVSWKSPQFNADTQGFTVYLTTGVRWWKNRKFKGFVLQIFGFMLTVGLHDEP